MSNCNCHNEDLRDGSAQFSRYLKALDPSYAPIDDRSMEELLVFIKNYASRIRFYDIPESKLVQEEEGSWQEFFSRDMAVVLASLSLTDVSAIKKSYEEIREQLEESGGKELLAKAFSASISIAKKINDWYVTAIPENPLNSELKTTIQSFLGNQIQKIMAYEEGYRLVFVPGKMNLEYHELEHNTLWGTNGEIFADLSIYEGATPEEKVLNAALYADEIFNSFLGALNSLVEKSGRFMKFALEEYPGHQPHMALFISFLKLFSLAQKQLNELPGRLLDYYYEDVLRLMPKNSLPDKVHIVFELAKEVMEYDIEKETALKAGKDDLGIEQVYMTEENLVVNQVKVKEIKTVYIKKSQSTDEQKDIESVYANPVANSADGAGKPFDTDYTAWPTFGKSSNENGLRGPLCEALKVLDPSKEEKNPAQIGFAVASPQLLLQGGNRLVTIGSESFGTLFKQIDTDKIGNPFEIRVTGESGWIKIVNEEPWSSFIKILGDDGEVFTEEAFRFIEPFYSLQKDNNHSSIVLFIPVSAESIIDFNPAIHKGQAFETDYPVMQILLNNQFSISDDDFNKISFRDFSLKVKVGSMLIGVNGNSGVISPSFDGLKYLILQNDEQLLEAGKSFDPFTANPSYGRSLYIGSEEVFNKPLENLSINIRTTKEAGTIGGNEFSLNLQLLHNKQWIKLAPPNESLFTTRQLTGNVLNEEAIKLLKERVILKNLSDYNIRTSNGFLRLDLASQLSSGPQLSREGFEIKEISLNYRSELPKLKEGIDQFFHVYPFGVAEITLPIIVDVLNSTEEVILGEDGSNYPVEVESLSLYPRQSEYASISPGTLINPKFNLLPQFTFTDLYKNVTLLYGDLAPVPNLSGVSQDDTNQDKMKYPKIISAIEGLSDNTGRINQYSGILQEEGILFIGLENARPLQSVSLLFQFASGSAADEDHDPPEIHWSYLFHNQWVPMNAESIVADDTYGFQTTGIIKFNLPKDITNRSSIITDGLCWIRASVTENSERIPRLINIHSQAVTAIFRDSGNSPTHYEEALKAETINKLQTPVAQISKVIQPFSSFDGKHAEVGKEFQTRISERLRHKQRAITAWDYEHLILERFPEIFKVKCITHTDPNCFCREVQVPDGEGVRMECCGPQVAPGHVLLVPIANLKNRNAVNRLQPKTSQRVLIAMTQYANKFASPFVKIFAKNPVYEQVIVFFKVEFISGMDKGYFLKKLNDEIVEYLTPWAFHEDADVVFGQKVYASSIIDFIEERPYVDFITDFEMGVCKEDCCPEEKEKNSPDRTPLETIKQLSNCKDVENIFNQINGFSGDIVVAPSTSRSLLVSAPRHFIFPYEAPPVYSICRRMKEEELKVRLQVIEGGVAVMNNPTANLVGVKNEGAIAVQGSLKSGAIISLDNPKKEIKKAAVKVAKKAAPLAKKRTLSSAKKATTSPAKKTTPSAAKKAGTAKEKKAASVKKQILKKNLKTEVKAKTNDDDKKDEVT